MLLLPPKELDKVVTFYDEEEKFRLLVEMKLMPKTAKKLKEVFLYKDFDSQKECIVVGYIENHTLVIQFDDGLQHCIHPMWLKEMQKKSFSRNQVEESEE